MRLEAVKNTSVIILHANALKINESHVTLRQLTQDGTDDDDDDDEDDADDDDDKRLTISSFALMEEHLMMETEAIIEAGTQVELSMWFRGLHRSSLDNGFFHGSRNISGEMFEGLFTQLQPVSARTVFPCIDEPERKAKFQVKERQTDRQTGRQKQTETDR